MELSLAGLVVALAFPPASPPASIGILDDEALEQASRAVAGCLEKTGRSPGRIQLLLDPEGVLAAVHFGQSFRAPVTEVQLCIQLATRTPVRLVKAGSSRAITWPDPAKPQPFPPAAPLPPWMNLDNRWRCPATASIEERPAGPCVTADGEHILSPEEAWVPGKATLTPKGLEVVDALAALLEAVPDATRVEIAHHEGFPREAYGIKLSQRRAEAVRDRLVRQGIAPSRLLAKGYGHERPLALPRTAAGQRLNERTEIEVLEWAIQPR